MIFKTGEVAIYAASLRFCPIVKFSGCEKFTTESKALPFYSARAITSFSHKKTRHNDESEFCPHIHS